MDSNQNGEQPKRQKRPRIGGNASVNATQDSRFEKVNYGRDNNSEGNETPRYERTQRPYQSRPRFNQDGGGYQEGGYQPRQQRPYQQRYNQDGGQSGYQPRPRYNNGNQSGYQPRPRYNQEGGQEGYQPRPRYNQNQDGSREGYQPRPRYNQNQDSAREGYQPRPRYNQNQDGVKEGYQPRPRYNQNQDGAQEGYQPRPRYNQGNRQNSGYRPNNNRQQGQNQGSYNRQGGNNRGGFQGRQQQRPGKSFTPRPKRIFYEEPEVDPSAEIRLNKYIANAGICSRREADELIQEGQIKVNGQVVTELGTKITPKDVVEYNEKVVTGERKCYVLLNKPKDCVTTSDDPNGRLTVLDLVKNACEERIYPVGRLDRNTTGVLLLTNDGDLAAKLTHPQYVKKKIYHVWTDHDIAEEDMQRIADGIELDDGPIHADAISYANDTDKNQAGIEIHSGRNRIVRRIFESLGYHVTKLDRVYFAGLTKKNLPRGRWRYLTQEEVNFLKMGSFE